MLEIRSFGKDEKKEDKNYTDEEMTAFRLQFFNGNRFGLNLSR